MKNDITVEKLASLLKLSPSELQEWSLRACKSYGKIVKKKPNGKIRTIYPPRKELKCIQQLLLKNILDEIPTPPEMCAGKGISTKCIMQKHLMPTLLVRIDLTDFFPNVKSQTVFRLLRDRGFSTDVATIIRRLTTFRGGLPQGSPCSPQLARLALSASANHIINLFSFPVTITFYMDDIIFSGPRSIRNFETTIYNILERGGFIVNRAKTKIMPRGTEQSALGLRVDQGKVEPDSKFMEKYREKLQESLNTDMVRGMKNYIKYIAK